VTLSIDPEFDCLTKLGCPGFGDLRTMQEQLLEFAQLLEMFDRSIGNLHFGEPEHAELVESGQVLHIFVQQIGIFEAKRVQAGEGCQVLHAVRGEVNAFETKVFQIGALVEGRDARASGGGLLDCQRLQFGHFLQVY